MADTIRVEGLRELQRAFARADKTLSHELRDGLKDAAEPVRRAAEGLAVQNIRRIGIPWSRMRTGVTRKAVYVAPVQRGVKSRGGPRRRANLFDLLLGRSLEPALDQNAALVEARMEHLLGVVAKDWEA